MGLRKGLDKLFGAGEYAAAKKTIIRLEEKGKLTGRDKKEKCAAEEVLLERRKFLQRALAATAIAAAGTVLGVSNKEKLGCEPDKKPSDTDSSDSSSAPPATEYIPDRTPGPLRTSEIIPTSEQMRATLTNGFNRVFKDIPENPEEAKTTQIKMLSAIKAFRKHRVKWSELRGRQFYSLEIGRKNDGWMVVLNPSNPSYHKRIEAFSIDTSSPDGIVALLIKPCQLAETWAGIFQAHELVHLHDMVLGLEPRKPNRQQYLTGELKAYFIERLLVDHLTNGQYSKKVQEIIKENGFQSTEEVERYINSKRELAFRELDQVVSSELPKSGHELALRQGFHKIVVSIEAESKTIQQKGGKPDLLQILAKVLTSPSGRTHVPSE